MNKPGTIRTTVKQTSSITKATRDTLLQQEKWDSADLSLQIFTRVEDAVRKNSVFLFHGCWWGPRKDYQREEGQQELLVFYSPEVLQNRKHSCA